MSHTVRLDAVSHRFGQAMAVSGINLEVQGGELLALLGPSGCGKSTLLRIIAGFIRQTEGSVLFDDAAVDALRPAKRQVGIVFQNYALFPHMTIAENVAYGLQAQGWAKERIPARVKEMLDLVHLGAFAARVPRELSGGQQQRAALARCLAVEPRILLLDEPFGALDKNLRLDIQIEVKRLQRASGITTILVTHDQEEALSMADRVAVMNKGRIEQLASPVDIYDKPESLFVNQFVGNTNILAGILGEPTRDGTLVALEGGASLIAAETNFTKGAKVVATIRPEHLLLHGEAAPGRLATIVKTVLPLGGHVVYDLDLAPGGSLKASLSRAEGTALLKPGDTVHAAPVTPKAIHLFPATNTP